MNCKVWQVSEHSQLCQYSKVFYLWQLEGWTKILFDIIFFGGILKSLSPKKVNLFSINEQDYVCCHFIVCVPSNETFDAGNAYYLVLITAIIYWTFLPYVTNSLFCVYTNITLHNPHNYFIVFYIRNMKWYWDFSFQKWFTWTWWTLDFKLWSVCLQRLYSLYDTKLAP